jgi:hypothetical protein
MSILRRYKASSEPFDCKPPNTHDAFDGKSEGRKDKHLSVEGGMKCKGGTQFTISVGKFVNCSPNPYDLIHFSNILHRNITFHINNEITLKWS